MTELLHSAFRTKVAFRAGCVARSPAIANDQKDWIMPKPKPVSLEPGAEPE